MSFAAIQTAQLVMVGTVTVLALGAGIVLGRIFRERSEERGHEDLEGWFVPAEESIAAPAVPGRLVFAPDTSRLVADRSDTDDEMVAPALTPIGEIPEPPELAEALTVGVATWSVVVRADEC